MAEKQNSCLMRWMQETINHSWANPKEEAECKEQQDRKYYNLLKEFIEARGNDLTEEIVTFAIKHDIHAENVDVFLIEAFRKVGSN